MIEPVADHDFTSETEHPHIVYQQSPEDPQRKSETLCNTNGNLAKVDAKHRRELGKRNPRKNEEQRAYTIELLVVLDKSLLDYHASYDVENYILTLFNMVSKSIFNLVIRKTYILFMYFFSPLCRNKNLRQPVFFWTRASESRWS